VSFAIRACSGNRLPLRFSITASCHRVVFSRHLASEREKDRPVSSRVFCDIREIRVIRGN